MEEDLFNIFVTLGFIVRGTPEALKDLLRYIDDTPNIELVFKKTSPGRLRITEDKEG